MIIDGHAYCFPARDEAAGYLSVDERWREFQRELGGHHQPVWRVRDRAPADNSTLIDPETNELRDVQFTVHRNRFTWDFRGQTYTKQYYPPMLYRGDAPAELLVTEMDYAGVDMALLHTSPQLGRLNDYLADAYGQYPDRLRWLVNIPESQILDDPDAAIAEATRWLATDGAAGYQFHAKFYYQSGRTEPWDGEPMRPFWDGIATPGATVYFTLLGARDESRYTVAERETYIEEQRTLARWMGRYPEVTVVITHGFPWRSYAENNRVVLSDDLWELFDAPQCHLQLLFAIQLGQPVRVPLDRDGGRPAAVRREHRGRPAHLRYRHAHGRPVLHLSPDPRPVPQPLRLPHRQRASIDHSEGPPHASWASTHDRPRVEPLEGV